MRVVIVGHGPSLKKAGHGKLIDSFDKVIRLKNCHMLLAEPKDYGTRTDVLCTSTETLYNLPKLKAAEYWGYPKKGMYSLSRVRQAERSVGEIYIDLETCNLWNCAFLEIGGKHPNVSTGTGALIMALEKFKPSQVCLAGFDNVMNPKIDGYQCTVPTPFNDGGSKDTGHDWQTENKLLPFLATFFQSEITDFSGHIISPGRV